jgi:omega-6 fatty acid desaturase (delta-12 desaturase)
VDHLPELVGGLRLIIVGHRQLRSEKKIADRVFMEYPVDQDAVRVALEIDPVIAATEAVKRASVALDLTEVRPVQGAEVVRKDLELGEQVELEIFRKGAHFAGADGIENDLEHDSKIRGIGLGCAMSQKQGLFSQGIAAVDTGRGFCHVPTLKANRTGKELIVATKPYAKDHPLRSWWAIVSTLLPLFFTFFGSLGLLNVHGITGGALRISCSVITGFLLLRIFVIYHDHQHRAILEKSSLASGLMKLIGILCLSPSSIWTSSHNHHHHHNSKLKGSNIGSFPVMTKDHFLASSKSDKAKYLFMRHPGTILFGYFFIFLYGMCFCPFVEKPRLHWDCLLALLLHVTIGIFLFVFCGWQGLILGETIPLLISGGLGSYLFYAQHNFPSVSFHEKSGWTYEKAALESSSFMETGPLLGWFTGNIGYHHIHHLNAHIPFYRLPEIFQAIPELSHPKRTSLRFSEIVRCLRLKVWDVELQRMVCLPC